jgi:hypothetical protein
VSYEHYLHVAKESYPHNIPLGPMGLWNRLIDEGEVVSLKRQLRSTAGFFSASGTHVLQS